MKIALKNQKSELARLLDLVEQFGEANELSPKIVFELNLSLDELFTNTVSYGYEDDGEHEILVDLWLDGGDVWVRIEDDARAFNPLDKPDPDVNQPLEERKVGGLGIFLVRQMMTEVEYRREGDRNIVRLRRTLPTG